MPSHCRSLELQLFDEVQQEIDWARSRISQSRADFLTCVDASSFSLTSEVSSETGNKALKLRLIKAPPEDAGHLLRDALKDLKDSFDRSLFIAATNLGANRYAGNYPWTESLDGLKATLRKRQKDKKKCLPAALIREIFRQKPFYGPDGTGPKIPRPQIVREVAKIANFKHSVGIKCGAAVESYKMHQNVAFNVVKMLSPWDYEKGEMTVVEVGPNGEFFQPDIKIFPDMYFVTDDSSFTVPAPAALLVFADAAQASLNGFKNVVSGGL